MTMKDLYMNDYEKSLYDRPIGKLQDLQNNFTVSILIKVAALLSAPYPVPKRCTSTFVGQLMLIKSLYKIL